MQKIIVGLFFIRDKTPDEIYNQNVEIFMFFI